MKTFKYGNGPFVEQPYYTLNDVEAICSDELQKLGFYPSDPSPVRIDRFIEKRFDLQPTYEDLPNGLLGFTRFGTTGVEEIVITTALDEEGTRPAERRLRTTLAHEGGHGLLHTHLFVLGPRPDALFGDGLAKDAPKILCRDDGTPATGGGRKTKPPYRWWEFQANMAMGALLLPKALVAKAVNAHLEPQGMLGLPMLPAGRRDLAIRELADVFDVNPVVVRIRLESLYPENSGNQLTL
jgi:hypothetical protein